MLRVMSAELPPEPTHATGAPGAPLRPKGRRVARPVPNAKVLSRSAAPRVKLRSLVERLAKALERERVVYLQWKGNEKRARWMSGEGDIDLLVDRAAEPRFQRVLFSLGFRRAKAPPASALAGIESYFGLDSVTGRLIHVHAYYRLVIGDVSRTVYRLPIEEPILASAVPGVVFPVPAPEFELLAFAVRMVQRYTVLDTVRRRQPRWLLGIQGELDALLGRARRLALPDILARLLPCLDLSFIDACLASLRPGYSRWGRLRVRRELHRRLRAHARRPPLALTLARVARWVVTLGGRTEVRLSARWWERRFAHGGTIVAVVGGDGAGKSTCAEELSRWLAKDFRLMRAHLGRPPRSFLTLAVGAVFKVARALHLGAATDAERARRAGYLAALRDLCTARDRYRLYVNARRFALAGGIALCERYPVPQHGPLCGPRLDAFAGSLSHTRFGRLLVAIEAGYYRQMLPPDVLIVLRVDPAIAVQRKTNEPADYVRARCQLVWDTDWTGTEAHIVDAGRPLVQVLADLKAVLWQAL